MNVPVTAPDAALVRWASSIASVRCTPAAIRPWTHARDDAAAVAPSKTARFGEHGLLAPAIIGLTMVARGTEGYTYWLARVPSERAVELHAGSEADEASFTAVLGEAAAPPVRVVSLTASLRTKEGLGLGSSRTEVERALGPGRARSLCGHEVVRYEPALPEMSEAELWFIYRNGRVVAFARYEAV
ncbi:MAG: hypothetical protein WAJ85_07085 [Candidatus Baltobacteraceae bacterium]